MEKEVVLYFIGFAICLFNIISVYFILNSKKIKFNVKFLLLIIVLSLIATIINMLNIIFVKSIISLLCLLIILIFYYKEEKNKAFNYSILIWLSGMLLDMISMNIFSFLVKSSTSKLFSIYLEYSMYIFTIIIQVVHNLLSRIRLIKIGVSKLNDFINKLKSSHIFELLFILTFIIVGIIIFNNISNFKYIVLWGMLIILLVYTIIYNIYLKYKCYTLSETNKIFIENNKFYTEMNTDIRVFKHNLIHKLNGLKINCNKSTKELIDDIVLECKLIKTNEEIEKLPLGIDGLLYQKLYNDNYKSLNVIINNETKSEFLESLKARNYNKLCEALGVTLDNALEASLESKEKVLSIWLEENKNNFSITIQNTFSSNINVDMLGKINYTTKKEGNGIGLFSIFLQNELKVKTKIINNLFIVNISIKKISN